MKRGGNVSTKTLVLAGACAVALLIAVGGYLFAVSPARSRAAALD